MERYKAGWILLKDDLSRLRFPYTRLICFFPKGEEFSVQPLQRARQAAPPNSCGCEGQVAHWAAAASVALAPHFSALGHQPALDPG